MEDFPLMTLQIRPRRGNLKEIAGEGRIRQGQLHSGVSRLKEQRKRLKRLVQSFCMERLVTLECEILGVGSKNG